MNERVDLSQSSDDELSAELRPGRVPDEEKTIEPGNTSDRARFHFSLRHRDAASDGISHGLFMESFKAR